ncbi:alpha-hemoglobin-stabilizing protein [Erinaceus europaeus]|uniref:Alpha-hemoglobin-stabilizing protein n=1 Tax=Erinaceus europaeus TaxID=9365 RepID=A0A1S3A6A8_ERIEU|nr:alpha-hemoglobin-stabilizing protein [Erinaceus europaeus]XP_060029104.1 alpha-hemoglobin-stabilizing protein [Erinaceus europaeus]XP_060029105.1 alpha-hemoglobin-stabilizing protein [Erinaceus europaeus]XP_060029106.1 alpha-hemoglobin-stabilizing protein [Erinaceus europaeus]XP_060029107.1 alpha-hemoglobin-stabilizing protein [Erinaceus europaeus]XP_060029108.1 alpha-hemoglobin-stabilizing protein [Erinaceus europaeus]
MAHLQTNKDLIAKGIKEFTALLDQQVFSHPFVSEEDMVVIVKDWMDLYTNYYTNQLTGECQEKDMALQELREGMLALSEPFLDKYREHIKSS